MPTYKDIGEITVTEHNENASMLWKVYNFESFIADIHTLHIVLSEPFQYKNRTWHFLFRTQSEFSKERYQFEILDAHANNTLSNKEGERGDFDFTVGINNTDGSLFKFLDYNSDVKAFILPIVEVVNKNLTTHIVEFHHRGDKCASKSVEKKCCLGDLSSELTIDVEGWEFKVNRAILETASPLFANMIEQSTRGARCNNVCVSDCEADDFQAFLCCLYTGNGEVLSTENVYKVYSIAEKYKVDWLKTYGIDYIKNNLSVDMFFNVVVSATKRNDQELLEVLKAYFKENSMQIVQNPKWKVLIEENSKFAKDLILLISACP